jgi:transcriptional regulator with XRE-family HTH domain
MAAHGWSRGDLAKEAGVQRQTVYALHDGKAAIKDQTIRALAKALGVDPPTLAADPFHLGVGDRAWFEMMAARYRRAAEALPADVPQQPPDAPPDTPMEPAPTSRPRGPAPTADALPADVEMKRPTRGTKPKARGRAQPGA